jgi:CRISPR-associated exonuclease Cas4
MFSEDDLLPLSALQHLVFCERQWGLIHLEQIWTENRLTAEGRIEHERVDSGETESRGAVRTVFSLRLHSLRLGLSGKADVVEFHRVTAELWTPFPVEHKHGRPKPDKCDEVQLCAQALCLEEMLGVAVPAGALFYGKPRRRLDIEFSPELRMQTEALAARLHELTRARVTPSAEYAAKCESCSLLGHCMPRVAASHKSVGAYLARAIREGSKEE